MLPPERMSCCPRNSHADISDLPNVTILVTLVLFAHTESGCNCRPGKHCTARPGKICRCPGVELLAAITGGRTTSRDQWLSRWQKRMSTIPNISVDDRCTSRTASSASTLFCLLKRRCPTHAPSVPVAVHPVIRLRRTCPGRDPRSWFNDTCFLTTRLRRVHCHSSFRRSPAQALAPRFWSNAHHPGF